jgi:hypothetical protein
MGLLSALQNFSLHKNQFIIQCMFEAWVQQWDRKMWGRGIGDVGRWTYIMKSVQVVLWLESGIHSQMCRVLRTEWKMQAFFH